MTPAVKPLAWGTRYAKPDSRRLLVRADGFHEGPDILSDPTINAGFRLRIGGVFQQETRRHPASGRKDSNLRLPASKAGTLGQTELRPVAPVLYRVSRTDVRDTLVPAARLLIDQGGGTRTHDLMSPRHVLLPTELHPVESGRALTLSRTWWARQPYG